MSKRNASSALFGWDFQVNSAILLMLENIKDAKRIRVEGADEDIEITLEDKSKIYAQVKAVEKPGDTSNVIGKLTKALETLSVASKNGDGRLFTYVTNSNNPFNNIKTISYFTGRTHLRFDELPDVAQNKIKDIVKKKNYLDLDVNKIDVRVIPFYGDDLKNRYKEIKAYIIEFLEEIGINAEYINQKIMDIWQKDLFHNATKSNTNVSISKEEMMWPLIVVVVEKTVAKDYENDFEEDDIEEIEHKYKDIINYNTMRYEMVSRVLTDYIKKKDKIPIFVEKQWKNYLDIVKEIEADEEIKESIIKVILYKILKQRKNIKRIKKGANLLDN
ncbi:MAG: hypothetical protein IJF94_05165 [Eubacterium sp.]|nr:hypothetical protein [Eubacterium sp.]